METEGFVLKSISVRNLASLALKNACPRCFWIRTRLGFKAPWSIFPSIFKDIDAFSKKLTGVHIASHQAPPSWLMKFGSMLGDRLPVPHWSKFSFQDPSTGIALRGEPDEMFRVQDGTLAIFDYKTARYSESQGQLEPLYRVQLGSYRWIAGHLGMGETSLTGLVYYEPHTSASAESILEVGFKIEFTALIKKVETNLEEIDRLLTEVKRIVSLPVPPPGVEGCRDCKSVDEIRALVFA